MVNISALQHSIRTESTLWLQSAAVAGMRSPGGGLSGDALVEHLQRVPGNMACADCGAAGPDWASLNLGVLLCIECSGVHRRLGVQASKVPLVPLQSQSGIVSHRGLQCAMPSGGRKISETSPAHAGSGVILPALAEMFGPVYASKNFRGQVCKNIHTSLTVD